MKAYDVKYQLSGKKSKLIETRTYLTNKPGDLESRIASFTDEMKAKGYKVEVLSREPAK